MRMDLRPTLVALLLLPIAAGPLSAQRSPVAQWREQNEAKIVVELMDLLRIPNVASDSVGIRRNAELLAEMFRTRGFAVEATTGPGSPVLIANLAAERPRGTITFYIHYDGQPVTASEWTHCPPFDPCVVGPSGKVSLAPMPARVDPDWRVYARSASDDKAPILALLNAVEALRATGTGPAWNVRVVLDGQEEAGSANFERFMAQRGSEVRADLAITLDGPRHPSGRPTLYYGVRGGVTFTLWVITARGDLHSGNYGNWAPDPSIQLGRLLASMKDADGRVLIQGFQDDVIPLTSRERELLGAVPNIEVALRSEFGIARPERPDVRLETKLNEPTFNVLAMDAAGGLDAPARTAIPAFARARIQMRMVNGLDPAKQVHLVIEHVRRQGYHVVVNREPTEEERLTHPLLARVDSGGGTTATRVSMDSPVAAAVATAIAGGGTLPVQLPTLGGTLPFGVFSDALGIPTVGLSLVNHDNNQHGPDENLRLGNLFEGIEVLARILTMPR